mgnify:CR=1 FL=1
MKPEELLASYGPRIRVDSRGLLNRALLFPEDLEKGLKEYSRLAGELKLPSDVSGVVIAGMGGSFIGGSFLHDVLYWHSRRPIIPMREATLPSYVNSDYMLIAVSYSGNTEETIRVLVEARRRGLPTVGVASGGLLEKLAARWAIPFVKLPAGLPPRAAFPYMCAALSSILEAAQLADNLLKELASAVEFLKASTSEALTLSDNLARWLHEQYAIGNSTIIYSYRPYLSAGYRLKTQINENAKLHAFFSEIPEANHNEIMGWEGPFRFSVILVRGREEPAYLMHRLEFLKELFAERGVNYAEARAEGGTLLQELLYLFYVFDVASILLSLLRGVDPAPTPTIDKLKKYLQERVELPEEAK